MRRGCLPSTDCVCHPVGTATGRHRRVHPWGWQPAEGTQPKPSVDGNGVLRKETAQGDLLPSPTRAGPGGCSRPRHVTSLVKVFASSRPSALFLSKPLRRLFSGSSSHSRRESSPHLAFSCLHLIFRKSRLDFTERKLQASPPEPLEPCSPAHSTLAVQLR